MFVIPLSLLQFLHRNNKSVKYPRKQRVPEWELNSTLFSSIELLQRWSAASGFRHPYYQQSILMNQAQQHLYFLGHLRIFGMSTKTLSNLHRCPVESILTGGISDWYDNYPALNQLSLQREHTESIADSSFPSIYTPCCIGMAESSIKNACHPGHFLSMFLHEPWNSRF